ncbi:MAG: hypothetical protein M1813_009687 [Trichoglossum hirsutum]|nr:MAG: hypothetical protein M1813_009687 [Trichoglossum hirsutum]
MFFPTMSNAQVLHLQDRIRAKLFQDNGEDLRKRVGHQNLLRRIQPLVACAELEILIEQYGIQDAFEDQLVNQVVDVDPTEWFRSSKRHSYYTLHTRLLTKHKSILASPIMPFYTTWHDFPPYQDQGNEGGISFAELSQLEYSFIGAFDDLPPDFFNQCSENNEWPEQNTTLSYPVSALEEELLQPQSAIEQQNTRCEDSNQEISNLEARVVKCEEVIEKLQDEKTRFLIEAEAYIRQVEAWAKDFKEAAETRLNSVTVSRSSWLCDGCAEPPRAGIPSGDSGAK